ncbi:hypothetical protein NDU88_004295 [Pleurodeles waltl]|uniref:Uncharacterized protein n=1 Tax=Pleurodeles waltl TaxID=8319 RepID=A0AAV7KZJ4_PLEWA|nr:hypothetical protein NDU88_004295 [Pleurodeles waltl]
MHCGVPTLSHSFLAPVPLKLDLVWLPGDSGRLPRREQREGLPSRNAETGDPKLTLPGSQSVARRREERILTLASLSFKPSPGWGPGAQTHADPAVKATAAFPSLTRPDSQTGARRRDVETPHPRPFILQAVARGGGQGGQTNVDPTGRNLCCFPEQRPREGLLTMQDARFRRHIRPTGVHGSSLADRHVPRVLPKVDA